MSHALLEKTTELPELELFPELEKPNHPYDVSFEVVVTPRHEHHPEKLDVYMHTGRETLHVDTLPGVIIEGETSQMKADFVKAAFTEACHDLAVTFNQATRAQMAGWTIDGGERRFVLKHKGEREVLRNMAYVAGGDAHELLGLAPHPAGDTCRAQMIFKYRI